MGWGGFIRSTSEIPIWAYIYVYKRAEIGQSWNPDNRNVHVAVGRNLPSYIPGAYIPSPWRARDSYTLLTCSRVSRVRQLYPDVVGRRVE